MISQQGFAAEHSPPTTVPITINQIFNFFSRCEYQTTNQNMVNYSRHVFASDSSRVVTIIHTFSMDPFRLNFISIDTDKHKYQRNLKQVSEVASEKDKMNPEF